MFLVFSPAAHGRLEPYVISAGPMREGTTPTSLGAYFNEPKRRIVWYVSVCL